MPHQRPRVDPRDPRHAVLGQPVQPALLGAGRVGRVDRLAHDRAGGVDAVGLPRLGAHAVVADVRGREGDQLAGEAGVGHRLLVARHAGREDDLAGHVAGRPDGLAVEALAVLEQQIGAHTHRERPLAVRHAAGRHRRQHPAAQRPPREAAVLGPALVAVLADLPLGLEVDEAEVGRAADRDRGQRQVEHRGAARHAVDHQRERERAGQHQLGVDRREGGLEPGGAHRRLLERHLLLLARVRRVVGGDAVDGAVAQALDQRLPVLLGAQRRVHLQPRVELLEQRLVGEREVVRRDLGGDPARRAPWPPRPPRPTRARSGAGCGCARPRSRRAPRRGRSASTRRPTGCRPGRAAPTPRPRA